MREILFRGKRIDNGEWLRGLLSHSENGKAESISYFEKGDCIGRPVAADTISQYTGLTDRSGKKIFEGDIIAFEDTGEEGCEYKEIFDFINRAVVVGKNGGFELDRFSGDNSGVLENMNNCREDFWNDLKDCKVIGNIFDNPKLLEVNTNETTL